MSGAFSDSAFGKDNAFSSGAFDFGTVTPVVTTVGGHFLPRKKRREGPDEHVEKFKATQRLREQIRQAIDGPVPEYIEPQKPVVWTVPEPELDWVGISRELDRLERGFREIEDDDDEDWLLLNG